MRLGARACIYTHKASSLTSEPGHQTLNMVSAGPIAFILALVVRSSVQFCAPDCTGFESGDFVRDPTDCTRYYVCADVGDGIIIPSTYPVDCPSGYYFNEDLTIPACASIESALSGYCSNLCNPCVYMCDAPGELTPNPLHCYSYYVCLENGEVLELECPASAQYFDYQKGVCSTDSSVCYGYCDICLPHCTQDNERVPDPYDCHNFYQCSPPSLALITCTQGHVFNRDTGTCETDAPCIVDC
ncbi:uncharacterized protein [Procambarus clarkii]|uniref:uncharacterized protein n=1 Tax=Procambarus clarkii TaxID=6728 RepID=UPI001E676DC8|nr:uncharacterized protein LOC123759367 [Procambarus clarkii]